MAQGQETPPEVVEAILADIRARAGSCRGIAKRHGIPESTVRSIAKRHGITNAWSREHTEAATKARVADMAERRSRLAEQFLEEAERALNLLHVPHLVYSFGGKDNDYAEHLLDRPAAAEMQRLMTTAAVATDKHLKLVAADGENRSGEAVSMLDKLGQALQEIAGAAEDAEETTPEPSSE